MSRPARLVGSMPEPLALPRLVIPTPSMAAPVFPVTPKHAADSLAATHGKPALHLF